MAKLFSWSYSKAKNFVTCPKRHYEVDLMKNFNDTSEALTWGNEVHDSMRDALTGTTPLPDTMAEHQKWVDQMRTGVFPSGDEEHAENYRDPWFRHLRHKDRHLLVEKKYAITKDFQPCGWSAWNLAWFRGICDTALLDPTMTVGIARDWKTGGVKHDSRQLMLMTQCIFANIPTLIKLKTEFVWLKDDCVTSETFDRATIHREWPPVLDIVKEMEAAAKTMSYPPKPSGVCRSWCPVTSCAFHGKGPPRR